MADLTRKVIVDTTDIKRAKEEAEKLESAVEKQEEKSTRARKRGVSKRVQAIRDGLAAEIREIRASLRFRTNELQRALKRGEITERKFAKRRVQINKAANRKIAKAQRGRGARVRGAKGGGVIPGGGRRGGGVGRLGKAGVAGAILATTAALTRLGKEVLENNVRFEAFDRRAKTVFGESLPQVEAAARDSAAALGLTQREFAGAAAATADLLVPIGATRQQAAELSTGTLELAGALKQFSGDSRSVAEVSGVLTKAYLGEREGLKSLGIAISEADIKRELQRRGTQGLTGDELALEKALITQELIFKKSVDAREAFANSSDSAARKQAELSASFGELAEAGTTLLAGFFEPFQKILTGVFKTLAGAIKRLVKFLNISNAVEKANLKAAESLNGVRKGLQELAKQSELNAQQQKRLIQLRAALRDIIEETGTESQKQINLEAANAKQLLIISNNLRVNKQQETDARIKNLEKIKEESQADLKRVKSVRKQQSAVGALFAAGQAGFENKIEDINKALDFERQTAAELRKELEKPVELKVKIPGKGAGAFTRPEFEEEDTTVERLNREQRFLDERLQRRISAQERETALLRQAEIERELSDIKEVSDLNFLEIEKEELRRKASQARSKRELKDINRQIKLKNFEIQAEKRKLAQIDKLRQQSADRANAISQFTFEFGQALLSKEEGSVKRFLANQVRAFAKFLSEKAAAQAALAFAAGNVVQGAALSAAAGVIRIGGEAAAGAIEATIPKEEPVIPQAIEPVADIQREPTIDGDLPAGTTIINNFDQSTNVEVIETGTYITEAEFVRDRVKPLINELEAERGEITFRR